MPWPDTTPFVQAQRISASIIAGKYGVRPRPPTRWPSPPDPRACHAAKLHEHTDSAELARLTGHPVRSEYKHPDEPDVLPPPDAIVVAPATTNTTIKWAAGISDTLALGLLVEESALACRWSPSPTPM
jgi:hypothetical protein